MAGVITSIPPLVEQPPGSNSSNPAGLPGVTYVAAIPTLPQTWTGLQTFNNGSMQFAGSTSGTTFLNATAIASGVLTLPAATDTLVGRNTTDTLTNKTLTSPTINGGTFTPTTFTVKDNAFKLQNNSDPTKQLQFLASSISTGTTRTLTAPDANTTLVGKDTTDTLTNKTFDTVATGNSFSINGLAATDNTGTGVVVRATSPTLVTPALGTPASGVATNLTGTAAGLTAGNVTTNANLTGPITSVGNTTSIASQTGTGTKFVVDTSPTLVTPNIGVATATSVNKLTITAPATSATLTIPNGVTLTGPAATGTAMTLGNIETVTGAKTFGSTGAVGKFNLAGTTSGSTTLDASAVASGVMTLPAATDTLVGRSTTDTLTNKTFDTAGTGNSLSIAGVAVTANTGTGAVVRATSPALTTPALGTPSAAILTNATGLPLSGLTTQSNNTIVGNVSGSAASPIALTATQATTIINAVVGDSGSGGTKGLVPAPGAGDAAAGKFLKADGTFAVPAGGGGSGRTLLTGNANYYVATTGSDSNNGTAVGTPFLTLQKALNVVFGTLDLGGFNATINVADGTYSTAAATTVIGAQVGAGTISIVGNTTTPANVIVTCTGDNTLVFSGNGSVTVNGFELRSATAYGMKCQNGFTVSVGNNMRAGTCAAAHFFASISGRMQFGTAIGIVGSASSFVRCGDGSFAVLSGITMTITGTPAFGTAFLVSTGLSNIPCVGMTITGTATGVRYTVDQNSIINTNGAGASYLPGNTAGTSPTGGQYI